MKKVKKIYKTVCDISFEILILYSLLLLILFSIAALMVEPIIGIPVLVLAIGIEIVQKKAKKNDDVE